MTNTTLITREKAIKANGHKPGIDPVRQTWTSKTGWVFKLKPVSWMLINRIQTNPKGKPEVPISIVEYQGGQQATEYNPDDPTYLEKLAEWKNERSYQGMLYCFAAGIEIDDAKAFKEFADTSKEFYPEAGDNEMRFLYITSLIGADEFETLMSAIIGQTGITEEGVESAKAGFSGNSEL